MTIYFLLALRAVHGKCTRRGGSLETIGNCARRTMELIHKRGIGIKKEIQLNCEQSKKTGSKAAADSFSCGRKRWRGKRPSSCHWWEYKCGTAQCGGRVSEGKDFVALIDVRVVGENLLFVCATIVDRLAGSQLIKTFINHVPLYGEIKNSFIILPLV